MASTDQEKIKIAREYFMRADQGRLDILELFHEDAEVYFLKFGFGFGRHSFLKPWCSCLIHGRAVIIAPLMQKGNEPAPERTRRTSWRLERSAEDAAREAARLN